MTQTISLLYCGDDTLEQGARYLWSIFKYLRYNVTYIPSRKKLSITVLKKKYDAIILSDYPSAMLTAERQETIVQKIEAGTGLLMVGGWGSLHGYDGHYERTKLKEILPVQCLSVDDRVNAFQGAVPSTPKVGGVLSPDLDLRNPPVIGGYNKVKQRPGSTLVLTAMNVRIRNSSVQISLTGHPLLVVGSYGQGKTCCYMSDFAPHWSGGLVDWGRQKIKLKTPLGNYMEVGRHYITLIRNIIEYIVSS